MTQIVLDREQADAVARSIDPIQVCDPEGQFLGFIEPVWSREEIEEAKRRLASDQPPHKLSDVINRLESLGN